MGRPAKFRKWVEGPVDCTGEHFKLRHNSPDIASENNPVVVLVGAPVRGIVNVQVVLAHDHPDRDAIVQEVLRELNYYLVELQEQNPWGYAQYHCSTASNVYSSVHWSFFKAGIAKSTALLDRLRGATILEVGGEGGTISLLGNRDKAGGWWLFWLSIDETALLEDLPEKVTTRFSKAAATPSLAHLDKRDLTEGMTRSISEAMLLLDRYPWTRLTPLQVRSEFHAFLLDEVWQRGGPAEADRWTQYLQDRTPQVLRPML